MPGSGTKRSASFSAFERVTERVDLAAASPEEGRQHHGGYVPLNGGDEESLQFRQEQQDEEQQDSPHLPWRRPSLTSVTSEWGEQSQQSVFQRYHNSDAIYTFGILLVANALLYLGNLPWSLSEDGSETLKADTGLDNENEAFAAASAFFLLGIPAMGALLKATYNFVTHETNPPTTFGQRLANVKQNALERLHNASPLTLGAAGTVLMTVVAGGLSSGGDESPLADMFDGSIGAGWGVFLTAGAGVGYLGKYAYDQHHAKLRLREERKRQLDDELSPVQADNLFTSLKQILLSLENSAADPYQAFLNARDAVLEEGYDRSKGYVTSKNKRRPEAEKESKFDAWGHINEVALTREQQRKKQTLSDSLSGQGLDIANPWQSQADYAISMLKTIEGSSNERQREKLLGQAIEAINWLTDWTGDLNGFVSNGPEYRVVANANAAFYSLQQELLEFAQQALQALEKVGTSGNISEIEMRYDEAKRVYYSIKKTNETTPNQGVTALRNGAGLFTPAQQRLELSHLKEQFKGIEGALKATHQGERWFKDLQGFMQQEGIALSLEQPASTSGGGSAPSLVRTQTDEF